jgi:methionyl-tRNA formyltransferase
MKENLRIVFLGTPEFAVSSLQALCENSFNVVAVVTAPDTPSGRGLKLQPSPVKTYALSQGIPVLQPLKLKDADFLEQLRGYKAELQVVVAFRMLPESVWNMPLMGTFNLHASLLPQYRGAAPINRAVMNGETFTGVTTFFLQQEIDTGSILFSERIPIGPEETAGELHDRMKVIGAGLVVKTARAILEGKIKPVPQEDVMPGDGPLKPAPKIFREDCQLNWNIPAENVCNHIRGLSPHPGAFSFLAQDKGESFQIKIFRAKLTHDLSDQVPGTIQTDGKHYLRVGCGDFWLEILELQLPGKRRMGIGEFLIGFPLSISWKFNPS